MFEPTGDFLRRLIHAQNQKTKRRKTKMFKCIRETKKSLKHRKTDKNNAEALEGSKHL